jgi:iron complex outermembrane receptor protein
LPALHQPPLEGEEEGDAISTKLQFLFHKFIEMEGNMRGTVLTGVSAFALILSGAGTAFAQSADEGAATSASDPSTKKSGEKASDEIVVTGTAIRGVAPVGSASVNIDRAAILESPVRDAVEIVRNLPQASGLGYQEVNGPVGQPANTGRGSGVNLRGLGTNATLVLIDGHRLTGQGTTDQFADPNQIPFAALERVEVVTDGASAIYGSDAVAGVVNYILRRNFDGLEVTGRYTAGIYKAYNASGVVGHKWSEGSVMMGFSYDYRGHFLRGERAYLLQDLRPLGGNDARLVGTTSTPGLLGNIVVNNSIYGLPSTNGAIPTAAQVKANLNIPNLVDSADYTWYQPDRTRYSFIARLQQDIGDIGSVSFTTLYSRRTSTSPDFTTTTIRIPSTSPYYIAGLTTTPNAPILLSYNARLNQKVTYTENLDESWNNTLDYRFHLGGDFELKGFTTYGMNSGCGACGTPLNPFITGSNATNTGLLTNSNPLFNPYQTGYQDAFQRAYGTNYQQSRFRLFDTVAKIDGSLFTLPGGNVRVAVGGEHTWSMMGLINTTSTQNAAGDTQRTRDTTLSRKAESLFGEVFVPIFSDENATAGFQTLNLSAAVRYDHYSDFGGTVNPKFGITWKPFDALQLRGSWGTSFRAPTLSEINPGVIELATRLLVTNAAGDSTIPLTNVSTGQTRILNRVGNTAGLKPETAHVWSLGADFAPMSGLKFSVTYYNVDYKDRIQFLDLSTVGPLANAGNRALYAPFITVAPQPATCVAGNISTYNPVYQPILNSPNIPAGADTSTDCQLAALFYGGQLNLGQVKQDGLDFSANYAFSTGDVRFNLGGTFSKILHLKRSIVAGSPLTNTLDTIGFQVSSRGRANVGVSYGGFSANLFGNYVGSYLNNVTITVGGVKNPDTRIPSWTTFDANLSYDVPEDLGFIGGLRLSVSGTNITDKAPPLVLSGTSAFDAGNANPFGRMVTFEISKKF